MAIEKQTFSSLIDEVISITGRKDRLPDLPGFVNASVLQCDVLQIFRRDMIEDLIVAGTDNYVWEHPANFRIMRTVEYPGANFPIFAPPGKVQKAERFIYYGGPGYYVFKGIAAGEEIKVAYYIYQARLIYYTAAARPAIYLIPEINDAEKLPYWMYWDGNAYVANLATPEDEEAARALVTNWLVFNWFDLVKEGAITKAFKGTDDPRSRTAFALFKDMQKDLQAAEPWDTMAR